MRLLSDAIRGPSWKIAPGRNIIVCHAFGRKKKVKKETFEVKKKLEMGQLEVWSQRPSASIYNDRRSSLFT